MIMKTNKIAFQGEFGANSDMASRDMFPNMEPLPCQTFEDAFLAVENGDADLGMIPIENTIAGRVADIHHLLPESRLHIVGEYFMPIRFQLMVLPGVTKDEVRTVHSHIHALGQCRKIVRLNGWKPVIAGDTAGAAKLVSETGDRTMAALAPRLAADLYGLFATRKAALERLRLIVETERLCPAMSGLETAVRGRTCFARQIARCLGACIGEEPIEEATRCLDLGARGIKLHPRAQKFLLNDERLAPVFAIAAERRVPILIHGGRGLPPIADDLARLVDVYPDAQLIIAHAGIADLAALMRHFAGKAGVYFDTSAWSPIDLLDFYRQVSPEQVLYASDFPYGQQPASLLIALRTARVAFEAVNPRLEQVARTLGAGPWRVFFTITLPLAARGLVAGGLLAFARALGEFGATIMVAGYIPGATATLSLSIYHLVQLGRDAEALSLLGVSVALAFGAVWLSEIFLRRRPAA